MVPAVAGLRWCCALVGHTAVAFRASGENWHFALNHNGRRAIISTPMQLLCHHILFGVERRWHVGGAADFADAKSL